MGQLLVATWGNGLVALDPDGGSTPEIAEGNVTGLVADGAGGALAVVDGREVRRRGSDATWSLVARAEGGLACVAGLGAAIFVGTDDARLLRCTDDGVLAAVPAFDRVAGRETWYAGTAVVDGRVVGPPLGVRSMAATCDGGALLVNVHVGGIPRSADGGTSFAPTIAVDADVHEVRAHPARPALVAAATARGLAWSDDAGATFTLASEGLHAEHASAVAFLGDDLLLATSTDPFSTDGALYRAGRGGPLHRVTTLPPLDGKIDTGGIATRGDRVAVALPDGRIYLSPDGARTWRLLDRAPAPPTGVLLL